MKENPNKEPLKNKLMLSCEQATLFITQEAEGRALSIKEKAQLKLHLLACKFCNLFQKQSDFLSKNIDAMLENPDESLSEASLSPEKKESLQKALDKEVEKNGPHS